MPFQPNFDAGEAETLVAFSAIFQGPTPPLALPDPPAGWANLFTSPSMGVFDNAWQLWGNDDAKQYAVVIRGTVDTTGSIFEDLMAVMIPAKGRLPVGSVQIDYKLAEDPDAAVHMGFVLGLYILLFDATSGILVRLGALPNGASVFIAGHSQGAAIATLCRSFLEYSPVLKAKGFSYKTYVFAQPKPGNDHYASDFEVLASDPGMGFRVTNSQDWVPQVPLTMQLLGRLNQPNPLNVVTGNVVFKLFTDGVEKLRDHLAEVHLARHVPQVQALEQVLKGQRLLALAPAAGDAIEIVPTLNFVNCGSSIILAGNPGTNPANEGDFFWQHHAAMYHNLLKAEFGGA